MSSADSKKFRTSREVVDRIRWDPALDESVFSVLYQERLSGDRKIPLRDFLQKDDLVWHRIYQICIGDFVVWDRENKRDLLNSTSMNGAENWKQVQEATLRFYQQNQPIQEIVSETLESLPIYRYEPKVGKWLSNGNISKFSEDSSGKSFTLVSYNILAEQYQPDSIPIAERFLGLLQILKECDADVIALQEATPLFLKYLLAEDWVMLHYAISDGERGETLLPYGSLFLSRVPLHRVWWYRFSEHKKALFGIFGDPAFPVLISTFHFTSDYSQNAEKRRRTELTTLFKQLRSLTQFRPEIEVLLVGDFNTRGNELEEIRENEGFQDVWEMLYPQEAGYTFDPESNVLSALTTKSGLRGRFDRLWIQGFSQKKKSSAFLDPVEMILVGTKPVASQPTLFPSDHFGLYTLFQRVFLEEEDSFVPENVSKSTFPRIAEERLVVQSALTLIPPERIWATIQAIRQRYDPAYKRWMPHLNLIYPFVPEKRFEEASEQIEDALAYCKPFQVRLMRFLRFDHSQSVTIWLFPECDPPEALIQLQAILQRLFPQWQKATPHSSTFSPHLTVAKLSRSEFSEAEITELINQWQTTWKALSFEVSHVSLIYRQDDSPFEVKKEVGLGQKLNGLTLLKKKTSESVFDLLQRVTQNAYGEKIFDAVGLYSIGSTRLGVSEFISDLDAVFVGSQSLKREVFFERVLQLLRQEGYTDPTRQIFEALNPLLELKLNGKEIDLQYAEVPESLLHRALLTWSVEELQSLDPTSTSAILGILDAEHFLEYLQKQGGLARFREALRLLKRWIRARGLSGQSFGFLGGFSWSLLLAYSLKGVSLEATPNEVLRYFFQVYANASFQAPIALDSQDENFVSVDPKDRWMKILAPSKPIRNTSRYLTVSTFRLLKAEFRKVVEFWSDTDDFERYCGATKSLPLSFSSSLEHFELLLTAKTEAQGQLESGKIQGLYLQFLLGLERIFGVSESSFVALRPYPHRVWSKDLQEKRFQSQWVISVYGAKTEAISLLGEKLRSFVAEFSRSVLGETTSCLSLQQLSSAELFFADWQDRF